jgi:hypothetical protein
MISTPTKSFGKIAPKLNAQLTDAQPSLRPQHMQSRPSNGNTKQATSVQLPPGPPISVPIEIWLETTNDPTKECPCFGYLSSPVDPLVTRLTVTFNLNWWPTAGAIMRNDENTLRWLAAMAITDRVTTWPSHPVLRGVGEYLAHLVGCPQGHQRGIWIAYALRNHEILTRIPELISDTANLPAKFAGFPVMVDSIRLADFQNRIAKRPKRMKVASASNLHH